MESITGRENKMNRPSQRRANPNHPHTQKAEARLARRHSRADARWHARWEEEQYGGSLNESHSDIVLTALARGIFEATPHRHTSGRRPDWTLQPAHIHQVFLAAALAGDFARTGAHPLVAAALRRLSTLALRRDDAAPSEAAIVTGIRLVTVDLFATADVDVTPCQGGLSIFACDTFSFHVVKADGSHA